MHDVEPSEVLERLAGCTAPWLLGVRHHSPACSAAMPVWLDGFAPDRILVELPVELGPWLPWLGHPELEAPVALSCVSAHGEQLSFYPFADFSPELAAVRWAVGRGVPVDVSGSMEPSVIYSAMMAAILSGMPALSVHFLAFNTEVMDMTERVDDPLGLLLEVQIGGGTHIARALRYARELITVPARTLVITVSDFEEGFSVPGLVGEVRALVESGARPLGVTALDDRGKPRYSRAVAELLVAAGMPVAALTPLELARWVGDQLR